MIRRGATLAWGLTLLLASACTCATPMVCGTARGSSKPTIVVDLDDTVVRGGISTIAALALSPSPSTPTPFCQAAESLCALQQLGYDVAFVTARPDVLARGTRQWLRHHRFPNAPVVFPNRFTQSGDDTENYKVLAIQCLRQCGYRPTIGVGDKASDLGAYVRQGMTPIFIVDRCDTDRADVRRRLPHHTIRTLPPHTAWPAIRTTLVAHARRTTGSDPTFPIVTR